MAACCFSSWAAEEAAKTYILGKGKGSYMNTTAQKQGWLLLVEQLMEQGWEEASMPWSSAGLAAWGCGELG